LKTLLQTFGEINSIENAVFKEDEEELRWSRFKNLELGKNPVAATVGCGEAYVDQLERSQALPADQIAGLRKRFKALRVHR
jgi:hypothetical protein